MKYDIKLIEKVLNDFKLNPNKKLLSRKYKIPRPTIIYWIKSDILNSINKRVKPVPFQEIKDQISTKKSLYNFILGLYLGDGCISKNKKSYKLRISQDNKYPKSIQEIKNSISIFFDKKSTITYKKGCSILSIFDKYLPIFFPQHGLGKKHDRKIELTDFQRTNIDYKELIRGLWTADGSYYLALKKYECYNFTNKSEDIINIFEECLNYLSIEYRKRVKKNGIWVIEITKKSEVLKMKKVVKTKS